VFVYVLLADDHLNDVSYFPFMSIKKVVPYFCVLREGIVLCFCFAFRRLVYPMLPVSLDCPFVIAPSVISNVYFLLLMQKLESLPGCVCMFFLVN
jgi:hypothetical protein